MWLRNPCFVCGEDNPIGMRVQFRIEDGLCVAECTLGRLFSGWHGFVHGGIIYSLLDDVMANEIMLKGEHAMTARCDVRYRQPLPVDTAVRLEGRSMKRKGRYINAEGRIMRLDTGVNIAEAKAVFMQGRPSL